MTETDVRHVEQESRYELYVDDVLTSIVGYQRRGDDVVLVHTATEPEFRNRGHATELVAAVLQDLHAQGLHTVARCPFVRWYENTQRQKDTG